MQKQYSRKTSNAKNMQKRFKTKTKTLSQNEKKLKLCLKYSLSLKRYIFRNFLRDY